MAGPKDHLRSLGPKAQPSQPEASGCKVLSGTWFSFYDGITLKSASRLDIDHVAPRANA